MYVKEITFLCLLLVYQTNALPFFNLLGGQDPSAQGGMTRQYATAPKPPSTFEQTSIDPNTGRPVVTHYITHTRPGSPTTALLQNVLNTVGRLVGDLGGALGNALGGTLAGVGQLGQDIQDFTKPIQIHQIVRPHPGEDPVKPLPANPPPIPFVEPDE